MRIAVIGVLLSLLAANASADNSVILEAKDPQKKTAWHIIKNDSGKTVLTNDVDEVASYEDKRKAVNDAVLNEMREKQRKLAAKPSAAIGMTKEQVRNKTNWGKPKSVNTTVSQYGTQEQWVYGDYQYLYFDNGKLTTIQQ